MVRLLDTCVRSLQEQGMQGMFLDAIRGGDEGFLLMGELLAFFPSPAFLMPACQQISTLPYHLLFRSCVTHRRACKTDPAPGAACRISQMGTIPRFLAAGYHNLSAEAVSLTDFLATACGADGHARWVLVTHLLVEKTGHLTTEQGRLGLALPPGTTANHGSVAQHHKLDFYLTIRYCSSHPLPCKTNLLDARCRSFLAVWL